jgi:hypothetical protein
MKEMDQFCDPGEDFITEAKASTVRVVLGSKIFG